MKNKLEPSTNEAKKLKKKCPTKIQKLQAHQKAKRLRAQIKYKKDKV